MASKPSTGRVASPIRLVVCVALAAVGAAGPPSLASVSSSASTEVSRQPVASFRLASTRSNGAAVRHVESGPVISRDARFVAFETRSGQMIAGEPMEPDRELQVYVVDRETGETMRVSQSDGVPGTGASFLGGMSADGRYVVFTSRSTNLDPTRTADRFDVYLHDRQSGTTTAVATRPDGGVPDGASDGISISPDGSTVVFSSYASDLVPGGVDEVHPQVYLKDLGSGTTQLVSRSRSGEVGNDSSYWPVVSDGGRKVAFTSNASNLVRGDRNRYRDVFVYNVKTNKTRLVSQSTSGAGGDDESRFPSISGDGTRVAFITEASNLVDGADTHFAQALVRDLKAGTTVAASASDSGKLGNGNAADVSISRDGTTVAFDSRATNLAPEGSPFDHDVFTHDLADATTRLVTVHDGAPAGEGGRSPMLSDNASHLVLLSSSSNLVRQRLFGEAALVTRLS